VTASHAAKVMHECFTILGETRVGFGVLVFEVDHDIYRRVIAVEVPVELVSLEYVGASLSYIEITRWLTHLHGGAKDRERIEGCRVEERREDPGGSPLSLTARDGDALAGGAGEELAEKLLPGHVGDPAGLCELDLAVMRIQHGHSGRIEKDIRILHQCGAFTQFHVDPGCPEGVKAGTNGAVTTRDFVTSLAEVERNPACSRSANTDNVNASGLIQPVFIDCHKLCYSRMGCDHAMEKLKGQALKTWIRESFEALSLDAIGFSSIERMERLQREYYPRHDHMLPSRFFPEAKSIVSFALNYHYPWNRAESSETGYIGRYTQVNFYRVLSGILKKFGRQIRAVAEPQLDNASYARVMVNSKILDKLAAYSTGMGFFAKNSLIFIPGLGTSFIIGSLLLRSELPEDPLLTKHCGTCTICQDACPTRAINEDLSVDREKCIQHLSYHHDWPEALAGKSFLSVWGTRFFGCADCVDSCPVTPRSERSEFVEGRRIGEISHPVELKTVLSVPAAEVKSFFRQNQIGSDWVPPETLVRNALASLWNLGEKSEVNDYYERLSGMGWTAEAEGFLLSFREKFLK
jgi:epoxyqueuosine reductase QueG